MRESRDRWAPDADDQELEQAVCALLAPLDRRLETFNSTCGLIVLGILIGVFLLLWLVWDWQWWAALLWAGVAFLAIAVVLIPLENLVVSPAVRAFNERFPEGHPDRPRAVELLRELESPSKAEEKLYAALTSALPDARIVRKRPVPTLAQIQAALKPFRRGGAPPLPDSPPHVAPGPPPAGPAPDEGIVPQDHRPGPAPDRKDH